MKQETKLKEITIEEFNMLRKQYSEDEINMFADYIKNSPEMTVAEFTDILHSHDWLENAVKNFTKDPSSRTFIWLMKSYDALKVKSK